jgi:mannose-6-phosphate isomerase-like protein (cupin superfamily)
MYYSPISLKEKFSKFSDQWSPKIIAQMNDYHIKLAKIQGDFIWHHHAETDETFMVIEGEMQIEFSDGSVNLKKGDLFVVPKGTEHKPFAENECCILLIEPAGVRNTGEVVNERTATNDVWI